MVEVQILGNADDLLLLMEFLRRQPALRTAELQRVSRALEPGEMGPLAEALEWTSQNKELATAFLGTIGVWLAQRRTKIKIRFGEREIEIDSTRIRNPDALTRDLLRGLSGSDSTVIDVDQSPGDSDGDARTALPQ